MNKMFINFKTFKIHVRRMFRDINAKRTVTRELINLKQKKVALIYVIQLQRVLFNLSWDNAAFTEQFYRDLKNVVKNDIAREE